MSILIDEVYDKGLSINEILLFEASCDRDLTALTLTYDKLAPLAANLSSSSASLEAVISTKSYKSLIFSN